MTPAEREALVERMAVAMAAPTEQIICEPGGCEDCDSWRTLARAALSLAEEEIERRLIEEMVEPSEDMLDSGACYEDPAGHYADDPLRDEGDIARDVWQAMLRAFKSSRGG